MLIPHIHAHNWTIKPSWLLMAFRTIYLSLAIFKWEAIRGHYTWSTSPAKILTSQVIWSCRLESGVWITSNILVSKWIHVIINTIPVLSPLLTFLFCSGLNQYLRWCVWGVGHSENMDSAAFHMWLSGKWWSFHSYVALPCEKPGFSCIDCWLYSCYYRRFSMKWLLIFTAESGKRSSSDL